MNSLKRIALCVEYDGTNFCGWQTQINQRTVQAELEAAVSKVANQSIGIVTAGRTDTAVHATAQIVHYETTAERSLDEWRFGINRFLPADVRVHWAHIVDDSFHARFSAISREYRYIFYNDRVKPSILRNLSSFNYGELDDNLMQQGANYLIGEHDFSSIRASGCQAKTPIRTIHSVNVNRSGKWVWFDIKANAFLQHMVRNIAGILIDVGTHKRSPEWVKELLMQQDRTKGSVTALPNGLYLTDIFYDGKYNLPISPPKPNYWEGHQK